MTLRLHNTLGGQTEEFAPLGDVVGVYSCGPTVYGPAHVGNFRSFVFADVLVRHLRWSGYRVRWVMNVTDVDDKIIRGAQREGVSIEELASRYLGAFIEDMQRLRIGPPDVLPRATQHIPGMVALIETLLRKDHAYRTDDGSIFFRIASWPAYGRLARLDPSEQRVGARVEADEYGKDDVRDFAVWKGPKSDEPSWATSIGEGRPGWHIECSAMSMAYLGESFDIHTGGVDLIFPHHEDEIAQSEAATGKPFVRTWLHCAHLQMGGQKMARREGNIERPTDVYERGHAAAVLRYALIAAHYRSSLEFSDESLVAAAAAVERLRTLAVALRDYREERSDDASLVGVLEEARSAFREALDDDLNTPRALAAVFDLARELNRRLAARSFSTADARRAADMLRDLDRVLAVLDDGGDELPAGAAALLEARAAARAARDWATSDRLRDELAAAGVVVEDTRDGQRWRRVAVESASGRG